MVTPPPQLQLRKGGVWTRAPVAAGVRFGPFLGKWVLEPGNEDYAWEVGYTFFKTSFEFLPQTLIFWSIYPYILKTMNSGRLKNLCLKYQRCSQSGCKDIGIRKVEFVTNTQFL